MSEGGAMLRSALEGSYGQLSAWLRRVGRPFEIVWKPTVSATVQYFTLDSTDYDWNGDGTADTAPFTDFALIITGLRIDVAASASITAFLVDEDRVIGTEASATILLGGVSFRARGFPKTVSSTIGATDTNEPSVADIFGAPLVCRRRLGVKQDTALSGTTAVTLYGWAIPRRLS